MAIVNGIGNILTAIIQGIVSLFDIVISCQTYYQSHLSAAGSGILPGSWFSPPKAATRVKRWKEDTVTRASYIFGFCDFLLL
jgi:hypothetical protein